MKHLITIVACALVFSASLGQGAEYLIYRDPAGKMVLSNLNPPPQADVIKRYELQDVTDEQVRMAQEREHAFWLRLKEEELAEANRKLAESNYQLTQAVITAAALRDLEPDVIQVAVSDPFPFNRFHSGRLPPRGRLPNGFRPHPRLR
jgi:hypothetical protein